MTGFYIYCRVWVGFSETFLWFDELHPLPDETLVEELNNRARNWLRQNKAAARKRYRDEQDALKVLAREASAPRRGCVVRGVPSMSQYDKMMVTRYLSSLDRKALIEEATRYGLQLALTDEELRAAILAAREVEHLEHEFRRQQLEQEKYAQNFLDQFDAKKRVRGAREETRLETRIARVAGWTTQDIPSFGGVSPTPKLMLRWVETEDELNVLLKVARTRFKRPSWYFPPTVFGSYSCAGTTRAELTQLEIDKDDLLKEDSHWTGTPLFQAVLSEFDRTVAHLQVVSQRGSGVSVERPRDARIGPHRGATADQIAVEFGREYFTIRELVTLSELSEDAVEGRIRRWAQTKAIPDDIYKIELPQARSGLARYMYRIQPIWPLLGSGSEISQKNSD